MIFTTINDKIHRVKIVVVGYGQMFSNLILGTIESGHKVVGVLRYDRIKYNPLILFIKDIFAPSKEQAFIKSCKLHEIKAPSVNSEKFKKEILKLNPDIILVGSWSEKLKKETFSLPKLACINCHPSLLPKYRGPNPYARTIMNGESESGITFHLMEENFDTGPILLQKRIRITKTETGETLKNKCCAEARTAVGELFDTMCNEILIPIKQNEKEASYYPQISVEDILIDLDDSADKIDCQIRGLQPWQSSYIPHKNIFFKVKDIEIAENKTGYHRPGTIIGKGKNSLSVVTGDDKIIIFKNAHLFGGIRKPLTNFYINTFIKIGDLAM